MCTKLAVKVQSPSSIILMLRLYLSTSLCSAVINISTDANRNIVSRPLLQKKNHFLYKLIRMVFLFKYHNYLLNGR